VCKKHKIWLMGDECYSHFLYDSHKPFSIASAKESKEHIIIVGSVSKTFAMTGWRIGYTLAPEPLVQAIIKVQSQSTSNPTSIAQYAALEAMTCRAGAGRGVWRAGLSAVILCHIPRSHR
jgi:aspartate aminotransferase